SPPRRTAPRRGAGGSVRSLLEVGLAEGRTASRAIGYAQIRRHLDGELSAAEATEETIVRTRQFARRQDTWFRRDPRIHWIDGSAADAERNRARALDILAGPTDRMET